MTWTRQNDDVYVNDDRAYNDYTDSKFNYSYSICIRPNNSVNYSYSTEQYRRAIRYSPRIN